MASLNNLPDIRQTIEVVNVQEIYNIMLNMANEIEELRDRIKKLEDGSRS